MLHLILFINGLWELVLVDDYLPCYGSWGKNFSFTSTNGNEFTWKGKTYSGYYNFFNIGAYEVTIDGVKYSSITRGLAYAAKLIDRSGSVWDNIETSITEGSSFFEEIKRYSYEGAPQED